MFQNFTVLSVDLDADAKMFPSGLNTSEVTSLAYTSNVQITLLLWTFHTLTIYKNKSLGYNKKNPLFLHTVEVL